MPRQYISGIYVGSEYMIREAKAQDYWRKIYKRKDYQFQFSNLNLNSHHGIGDIKFNKGIYAICGLNGTGKSTIISCIKEIIGLKLTSTEKLKIPSHEISLTLESQKIFTNIKNKRIVDKYPNIGIFFDYQQSMDAMNYFINIDNIDELLEQYEPRLYLPEDLKEVEYLVGKHYDTCSCLEIEISDEIIYPYFIITTNKKQYSTQHMGVGEHFIFYLHWLLSKIEDKKIIVLEEPETFVSIKSQNNIMNFLARIVSEKAISVIISTHSPFIINNIRKENLCVVNKLNSDSFINYPSTEDQCLIDLGINLPQKGILYFEDIMGQLFTEIILNTFAESHILNFYSCESLNGYSDITKRLLYPISDKFKYKIVGIYDGDVKSKINAEYPEIISRSIFLPLDIAIELEFQNKSSLYVEDLCIQLDCEQALLKEALCHCTGDEPHDWFLNIAKRLSITKKELLQAFFKIWIKDSNNYQMCTDFVVSFLTVCK